MSPSTEVPGLIHRSEELARPLYAGLDGVQTFDRVARARARLAILSRDETALDRELLEVLTVFHGIVPRLGTLGPGGRFDLFLSGQELAADRRALIRRGLGRFSARPRTLEERLLHDAALLEEAGVAAAVGRLMAAGKKRVPASRAVAALDPGPSPERFMTPAGIEWAARELRDTGRWLAELETHFSSREGGPSPRRDPRAIGRESGAPQIRPGIASRDE